MATKIIWIAGPVQYWEGRYRSFDMAWEFVGEINHQQLSRWRLQYSAQTRKFNVKSLPSDTGDQAHISVIRDMYRHIAVPGVDLKGGKISEVLRAMLPTKEIVFASRLTIGGRG